MKYRKILLSLLLVFVTLPALAQDIRFTPSYDYEFEYFKGWRGLRFSYLPTSIHIKESSDIFLNGAMLSYTESWGIVKTVPLYIESGAGLSYIGGEIKYSGVDLNIFSVQVPVVIGYCHHVNNAVSISPFAGVTLRGNLAGHYRVKDDKLNAFDKDEVGTAVLKRFNAGWQIGLNITCWRFHLTGSYGRDFNRLLTGGRWCVPQVAVGVNF